MTNCSTCNLSKPDFTCPDCNPKASHTLAEHIKQVRLAIALNDEKGLTLLLDRFTFADDGARLKVVNK